MKAEIFYFSGTGNSLYIARQFAGRLNCSLIPVASLKGSKEIRTDADAIGIVFPVYYGRAPAIIREFVQKLKDIGDKYIFAVSNFGGAAGRSLSELRKLVRELGGRQFGGFAVHMPQNAFLKPWEKKDLVYATFKKRAGNILRGIEAKKEGIFYANIPLELMMLPMCRLIIKPLRKKFLQLGNGSEDMGLDELMRLSDRSYRTNEKCTGCGICAQVCPVGNIKLTDGKPVWLNQCETCLACYNWCPSSAIEGGVSGKGHFYRHPEIKVSDMK